MISQICIGSTVISLTSGGNVGTKRTTSEEPLCPELAERVNHKMQMIYHPLVTCPYYSSKDSAYLNKQLEDIQTRLAGAVASKNWSLYLMLHARQFRLDAFEKIVEKMADKEYWQMLGEIWVDAEGPSLNKQKWIRCLSSPRTQREQFMTPRDRQAFKQLPATMVAYRGCIAGLNEDGLSWTLSKPKAQWFAKRIGEVLAGIKRRYNVIKVTVDLRNI